MFNMTANKCRDFVSSCVWVIGRGSFTHTRSASVTTPGQPEIQKARTIGTEGLQNKYIHQHILQEILCV